MKSSQLFLAIALFFAGALRAGQIDMDDPRRAVGREDDIRVDAQLLNDTVSPGATIAVTYQIHNLTSQPIAVAEKLCTATYDADSRTVTVAIGSEVPAHGVFPRMVVIAPERKKTFSVGAIFSLVTTAVRSPFSVVPRYVQIRVSVLRDLVPFHRLLQQQAESPNPVALTDDQFAQWLESNESIFLNPLPVRFDPRGRRTGGVDAESHSLFGSP